MLFSKHEPLPSETEENLLHVSFCLHHTRYTVLFDTSLWLCLQELFFYFILAEVCWRSSWWIFLGSSWFRLVIACWSSVELLRFLSLGVYQRCHTQGVICLQHVTFFHHDTTRTSISGNKLIISLGTVFPAQLSHKSASYSSFSSFLSWGTW
jgi:hypothetical protein